MAVYQNCQILDFVR